MPRPENYEYCVDVKQGKRKFKTYLKNITNTQKFVSCKRALNVKVKRIVQTQPTR